MVESPRGKAREELHMAFAPPADRLTQEDTEGLGDRIAELEAQIEAATIRLLAMIREFDEGRP
ncbi:MAG: hypothetical protein ACE5EL_00305 [Anaerolineae bacterium]